MLIARWRSLLSLKFSPNLKLLSSKTFHSTSILSENSRKKFGSSGKVCEGQRASKNSIRFTCTVKEKRSDTKKALNNLLFHTKGSRDFRQAPGNGITRFTHLESLGHTGTHTKHISFCKEKEMGVTKEQVEASLTCKLNPVHLQVIDTSGGCGASFAIEIVSEQFEGKRLLERHRIVNAALEEEMKEIHALSIKKAQTPQQWKPTSQDSATTTTTDA